MNQKIKPGVAGIKCLLLFTVLLSGISLFKSTVNAETRYASKERTTIARAHMSRARILLVEALAEFEEGRKYARPDLVLDSEDWRLRVVSLTEQLNRVIDPTPRVTREGAVFRAPPRFVKREKSRLPVVPDGAKPRSDYGEKKRLEERQNARAKLYQEKKEELEATKEKEQPERTEESAVERDGNGEGKKAEEEIYTEPADQVEDEEFTDEFLPEVETEESFKDQAGYPDEPSKSEGELREKQDSFPQDDYFKEEATNDLSQDKVAENANKIEKDESLSKRPSVKEEDFDTLPQVIEDTDVEEIGSRDEESSQLLDEELTRRLEESIAKRRQRLKEQETDN